jgi:hypothetical protein
MSKSMNPYILDEDTLREIFELRLVLEIGMADLIFQKITQKDIDELKEIVKNEPSSSESHLFNIEHEINFHGKLYEITGNKTLKSFQKMLLPIFDYVHNSGLLKRFTTKEICLTQRLSRYFGEWLARTFPQWHEKPPRKPFCETFCRISVKLNYQDSRQNQNWAFLEFQ